MVEIITEHVEMPQVKRFKKEHDDNGNKWWVVDTETDTVRYKGRYEDVCIAWHNLNKKHYRDLALDKNNKQ